jgi:nucleoside-diphosphate-sugar epimerase
VADLDRPRSLRRVAGLADAVLHFAPPPPAGARDSRTRRLLAALSQGRRPGRLVYVSTSGVYGDCGGGVAAETRPARPLTARARRRMDAETVLRRFGRETGARVSILRAPGIYAADRLPIERLRRALPSPRAEEDVFTNHIHADDLARAACAALRRGRANRVYNAADDSRLKLGDYLDLVADRLNLPRPPRATRREAEAALDPARASFLSESRRLDNRRLRRELGLRLRYPSVEVGLTTEKGESGLTTENTESTEKKQGKTTNHRDTEKNKEFAFDFLCVSVPLWLKVQGLAFLRALRALRG